jgi:hypothetical protein
MFRSVEFKNELRRKEIRKKEKEENQYSGIDTSTTPSSEDKDDDESALKESM